VIGFFGGSFDPVHFGHLKNASSLKDELDFDSLFLMPCSQPVQKSELLFSVDQRLDMLNLATQEFSELSIDLREIYRNNTSYTIDSLKQIRQEHPNKSICLIVGMDCFVNLSTWKKYEEFHKYVHLVVIDRPEYTMRSGRTNFFKKCIDVSQLQEQSNGLLFFSNSKLLNISSSDIRNKIADNQNVSGFMPTSIINYIKNLNET
jgi:nicotinate-nucleotide adenylyltransferase